MPNDTDARPLPVLQRPSVRKECADVPRPCPFVSCRHNMYLDISRRGIVQIAHPDLTPDQMDPRYSCVLDIADRGAIVLDRIAEIMGLTRERVRQIEMDALRQVWEDESFREFGSEPDELPSYDIDAGWEAPEDDEID